MELDSEVRPSLRDTLRAILYKVYQDQPEHQRLFTVDDIIALLAMPNAPEKGFLFPFVTQKGRLYSAQTSPWGVLKKLLVSKDLPLHIAHGRVVHFTQAIPELRSSEKRQLKDFAATDRRFKRMIRQPLQVADEMRKMWYGNPCAYIKGETAFSHPELGSVHLPPKCSQKARQESGDFGPTTKRSHARLGAKTAQSDSEDGQMEETCMIRKKKPKRRKPLAPTTSYNEPATADGKCSECGTRETPRWRRGPEGQRTLCNACGQRWAKNRLKVTRRVKHDPHPDPRQGALQALIGLQSSDYSPETSEETTSDPEEQDANHTPGVPKKRILPKRKRKKTQRAKEAAEEEKLHSFKRSRPTPKKSQSSRPSRKGYKAGPGVCTHCGTTSTPLWRRGPRGPKSLCNACGQRWAKAKRLGHQSSFSSSHTGNEAHKKKTPANPQEANKNSCFPEKPSSPGEKPSQSVASPKSPNIPMFIYANGKYWPNPAALAAKNTPI